MAKRCLSTPAVKADGPVPETEIAKSNKKIEERRAELEMEKSPLQRRMDKMTKVDPYMVTGSTEDLPEPELPDNPAEISALDRADMRDRIMPDGSSRVVEIRQGTYKVTQNPMDNELKWVISFGDNGETARNWKNPLMGWDSSADPMSSNMSMQLEFDTASEAVYFAKKRGWNYRVDRPRFRQPRDDAAQYQDVFLPQVVASKLKKQGKQCAHWERPNAGASHYTRPLKYHGDGLVRQHGPNREEAIAPDVESYYKMR